MITPVAIRHSQNRNRAADAHRVLDPEKRANPSLIECWRIALANWKTPMLRSRVFLALFFQIVRESLE